MNFRHERERKSGKKKEKKTKQNKKSCVQHIHTHTHTHTHTHNKTTQVANTIKKYLRSQLFPSTQFLLSLPRSHRHDD